MGFCGWVVPWWGVGMAGSSIMEPGGGEVVSSHNFSAQGRTAPRLKRTLTFRYPLPKCHTRRSYSLLLKYLPGRCQLRTPLDQ